MDKFGVKYGEAVDTRKKWPNFFNSGTKYAVLLQLPYCNAVCFVIIDPMHNRFLRYPK